MSNYPFDVFISYAHKDKELRNALDVHLSNLKRQNLIRSWYDGDILPGSEWRKEIEKNLENAQIILLLISADFIHSDFCYSIEMNRALERHQLNEARVIPILLRPVDYEGTPFAELEMLPEGAKPIARWSDRDEAYSNVARGIRRTIENLATVR